MKPSALIKSSAHCGSFLGTLQDIFNVYCQEYDGELEAEAREKD
jgi:hypothetical protein